MKSELKDELKGLSDFIGFSAPEVPKYLILNNFLSCYFDHRKADNNFYSFDDFRNILTCEESDDNQLKRLEKSFEKYFSQYTGENMMSKKTKAIYLPINKNMIIIDENTPLRNLPHRLLRKSNYEGDITLDLESYLFSDSLGTNEILSFLCSNIKDIKNLKKKVENETDETNEEKKTYFKDLAKKMGNDLKIVLTHPNFTQLDYYRKIEYLSTLLAFYAVLYIIKRPTSGNKKTPVIICKGSAEASSNSNEFHRACLVSYGKIREGFNTLFKDYFSLCLKEIDNITIRNREGNIEVDLYGNTTPISEFLKSKELGNPNDNINRSEKLLSALSIVSRGDSKTIPKNEFILRYINFLKNSSGSSYTKTSSTLPTLGRESGIIFPLGRSRYKYFALSEDLAEYFVRLYLSERKRNYDYLDSFINWLEYQYDICIIKSEKLEEYLKSINAKIPVRDFMQNEEAFIQNLSSTNCLIKMSDNGYVITLPEKKGEFKLL
jgi:hypothetical protein